MDVVLAKQAVLVKRYGPGKAWDKAGLFFLNPPIEQRLRDGSYQHIPYVLVMVQGDTADMYEADATGRLAGEYSRWTPLTRDDGEARGLFMVTPLTCTGAIEAEGYTITDWGGVK